VLTYRPSGLSWSRGKIYTETWTSRMVESQTWDNEIRSWVLRNADTRGTALGRSSRNCKLQTSPLFREWVMITNPQLSKENFKGKKQFVTDPRCWPDTRTKWSIVFRSRLWLYLTWLWLYLTWLVRRRHTAGEILNDQQKKREIEGLEEHCGMQPVRVKIKCA
jgi:hypothetical protein